jgi:phosphoglycolate phosphatase
MRIPIAAVLFDFDGTLVETALDFDQMRQQVQALALRYGVPLPQGMYVLEAIDHVRRSLTDDEPQRAEDFVRKAKQILVRIEMEGVQRATPLSGVEDMLDTLVQRGVGIGIVTRNCRVAVEAILERFELAHHVLLTRDDVVRAKPDPAHLLEAASRLNSRPPCTLMVGDHPMDILAGRRAGMHAAAVTSTRPKGDFADVGPDLIVERVPDILQHIAVAVQLG